MRFASTFVALALAGCATGATTASPARYKVADLHPLAVGNAWTYSGKMMGQPVEKTITITGLKDGYYVDDANGKLAVDPEGLRDEKRYLLREPVKKGATWSSIVSVSSTERYEIVDVGFTTTVPAGTYSDCVQVRGTNRIDAQRELRTDWTFAPGVGIIRIAMLMKHGDKELPQGVLELRQFKKAP
jgi:hypothetical protein